MLKSLKVLFALGVILGPKIHKKCKKSTSKKHAKNDTPKNNFFRRSGAIFVPKKAEIKGFWMDFGCQVWSFSKLFLAQKFWMFFLPFLSRFWRCFCFFFFSTCRPLRKYAKTNTKQTFSHFALFVFFDKKGQKTIQNFSAKKSLEKDHTWHPKSPQNPVLSAFLGSKIVQSV